LLQLGEPYETVASTLRALAQLNDTAGRSSAAYALGKATKPNVAGAIDMLTTLLADPLPGPKIVAVRSLGHIGNRSALPLLKGGLHDPNEAVRATAGGAVIHVLQLSK
jgi:HEAT repeat protein